MAKLPAVQNAGKWIELINDRKFLILQSGEGELAQLARALAAPMNIGEEVVGF